jgi:hypothetical protein
MYYNDDQQPEYFYSEYYSEGMGFLPGPAIAASAGAGPVGWVVAGVATAASFIGKLFGWGVDDQKTSYRPPPNSKDYAILFDDKYGQEYVAYDMGAQTQQISAARGNRWDDMSSYYAAFISGNTNSGTSSAARRVIEDVARQHGVSISRAADLVLQAAGAVRLVQAFKPGPGAQQGSQQGQATTGLPGYCPVGTYHPYPIGHPQQDLCVPFPEWGSQGGSNQQQQQSQAGSRTGTQTGARSGQTNLLTPGGSGQRSGVTGQQGQGQSLFDLLAKMPFPLWVILALVIALMLSGSGRGETVTTITRRKK